MCFVRPPGTLVPKAFCFSRDVFYIFLTKHRISELRRPIAAKLCSDQHMRQLFNASPKIRGGGPPLKLSSDSSRVQPNKSGELWSTIHKVVHVSLDPPILTFSTDCISAPRGCWVLKFLHVLEFDQSLVAHIAIGVRGPLKNFKGEHLKLGLKFHTWAPITLG